MNAVTSCAAESRLHAMPQTYCGSSAGSMPELASDWGPSAPQIKPTLFRSYRVGMITAALVSAQDLIAQHCVQFAPRGHYWSVDSGHDLAVAVRAVRTWPATCLTVSAGTPPSSVTGVSHC